MNDKEQSVDAIHWKESSLMGNPYRRTLHPAMLSKQGFSVTLYPKVRKKKERTQERVKYDRQFLAEKFVREFLCPLGIISYADLGYLLAKEIREALLLFPPDEVYVTYTSSILDEEVRMENSDAEF